MSDVYTNQTVVANLASLIAREVEFSQANRNDLSLTTSLEMLPAGANSYAMTSAVGSVGVAVTDGNAIPLTANTNSRIVYTPTPLANKAHFFTDLAAFISNNPSPNSNIIDLVDGCRTKVNQDIVAQYANFGVQKGGATTDLTLDLIQEAAAELGDLNTTGDKFLVTTYTGWLQLIADLQATGADILSDAAKDAILRGVVAEANIGSLMGFTPIVVPATVVGVSANFAAFYDRSAMGLVVAEWYDGQIGGYDALRRGYPVSVRCSYEVKPWQAAKGIKYTLRPKTIVT